MTEPDSFHMTADEFRTHGRAVIDWIADYMERVESLPVVARVQPGDIRAALPAHPPAQGESFDAMLRDLDAIIMPGITHWQSPNFFGYFPANNSGPSILGELLSAGLGVQGMLWLTSPACTELETHVLDWLVEILDLPVRFSSNNSGGVIQDTASSAALCALLAGRERAANWETNARGIQQRFTCYTSSQAHSSIEKAAMIAGIGRDNLRMIEVDANLAMRPDALENTLRRDISDGATPCFVCATVGTTSSNAMDPIRAIADVIHRVDGARRKSGVTGNVWLHVDAAMSGTAALCPEFRAMHDGLERADSYCFNPHKWMFTNFDCNCFYVADRAALIRTLSILPEYLKNEATQSGAVFDYRDWHIPLGRRFRALKLWFVIRHYGIEGLQHHVREHVRLAQEFANWVRASDVFELAVDPPLNLVCFHHRAGDDRTERIMQRVNRTGKMFITHTRLFDRFSLRMSIGQAQTERRHVEDAWRLLNEAAGEESPRRRGHTEGVEDTES